MTGMAVSQVVGNKWRAAGTSMKTIPRQENIP
jgi:hypothetical protein